MVTLNEYFYDYYDDKYRKKSWGRYIVAQEAQKFICLIEAGNHTFYLLPWETGDLTRSAESQAFW